MIRLVVTGRSGQVAASLQQMGRAGRIEVIALGPPELDLERPATVADAIAAARPDVIVNAAAYTAVDRAESEEDKAFAVNRVGAAAVAMAATRLGVPLIQLSTGYVYSGEKTAPYVESDEAEPLNTYGKSKLAGEVAVRAACPHALILRTSWVYSPFGSNFVKTMLRLGRERAELRVVDDQTGNPTSALDLAGAILRLAAEPIEPGIFNLCGSGSVSWHGFARHIFEVSARLGGPAPRLTAITTAEFPTPARRPRNSSLSTAAFEGRFGFRLRPWQEEVNETLTQLLA